MSTPTNNATNNGLFISSNSTPIPQSSWLKKGLNATSSFISGTGHYATRPIAWAFRPMGDGLGSGAVSGAERELTAMLQPNGSVAEQVKTLLTNALIKRPPQELYRLKEILDAVLIRSQPLTRELAKQAHDCIALLNEEALQKLAPDLSPQGKELIRRMDLMFQALVRDEPIPPAPLLDAPLLDIALQRDSFEMLSELISIILKRQEGSIVEAMAFLEKALVGDGCGIIGQAIDILKSKLLETSQTSLKTVEKKLSELFSESPHSLRGMLDEQERRDANAALALLRQKTTASIHAPQEGLKEEEKALIKQAIRIAKNKITLRTNQELQVLIDQLNAPTGLLCTLKNTLSISNKETLIRFQALLERKLYPINGVETSWSQQESAWLAETLQLIAEKYIAFHEASIKEGIDLVELKLNGDEGVLSTILDPLNEEKIRLLNQARTRLRRNWVGLGSTVHQLAQHQFQEVDRPILEAIQFLQTGLKNKEEAVLKDAQLIIEARLNVDESTIEESKKLNANERSLLREINSSINGEPGRAADLPGNTYATIQSQLNAGLKIVQIKNSAAAHALQAIALEQLCDKIKRERATLSRLELGLTDPTPRVLLPLLKTAEEQLIAQKSPLTSLEARIDSDTHDIITQAIDLLNAKLFDAGGPIDGFRRTLVDDGGIFDQVLRLLNTRLLDSEKGILTQAVTYLKTELNALVEVNGPLDQFSERLNGTTHPALTQCGSSMALLKNGIDKQATKPYLHTLAVNLIKDIDTLEREQLAVFFRAPLRDGDLSILTNLKRSLAGFSQLAAPNTQEVTSALEHAIAVINHHLKIQGGLVAGTAKAFADQLTDSVLQRGGFVDRLGKQLTDAPHPDLSAARESLLKLQTAVTGRTPRAELIRLAAGLAEAIQQLLDHQNGVFQDPPLRETDIETFQALLPHLLGFQANILPRKEEILPPLKETLVILNHHFYAQAGYVERVTDAMARGFEPFLNRVTNLPSAIYNAVLGRNPEAPGPIEEAPPEDETGQVTIGIYLRQAMECLASSAASQKMVESIATSLLYALESALESIEGMENFEAPRETLRRLIIQVTRVQTSGSIKELQGVLKTGLETLNTVNIYINGLKVPKIGTLGEPVQNPETRFLENISELRTVLQKNPETGSNEEVDWKVKVQEEKEKFVSSAKSYLTMRFVYEKIFRLTPASNQMYSTLIRDAEGQEDPDTALKHAFFRHLEHANISWFKKIFAYPAYSISSYLLNKWIQNLTTSCLEEAFEFIDENKIDDFNKLKSRFINRVTDFLVILGAAYGKVAHNPQPGGRIVEALKWELDKPECNFGTSTSDLYENFAEELINKCIQNPLISWLVNRLIPNKKGIMNAIVSQSIGSLIGTSGSVHPFNLVIASQLRVILEILEQRHAESQRDETSFHQDAFSKHKRNDLQELVENIFDVLKKSKCQTQDELRDVVDGKSLTQNAVNFVDNLFIQDVIQEAVNIMALAIRTFAKEDRLHKLIYEFIRVGNNFCQGTESYTLDEVNEKEQEITALTDKMLALSVRTAVARKFDFTGTKEQQETNRQISDLRKKTETLTESASNDLQSLGASDDLNSTESTTKLKAALQEALLYQTECSNGWFQAQESQLNTDNKEALKIHYRAVAENSAPYVKDLSTMRHAQKEIEEHAELYPELQSMLQISHEIAQRLCGNTHTLADMAWARDQITFLEHHLEQANRVRNQGALTQGLTGLIGELAFCLNELQHLLAIMEFGLQQGTRDTSLVAQIVREKQQTFRAFILPASIRTNIEMLKSEIRSLNDNDLSKKLFAQIQAIQSSSFQEQLDNAFDEFRRLILERFEQSAAEINPKKERIRDKTIKIQELINRSSFLENNYVQMRIQTMQESLVAARENLKLMTRSYETSDNRLTDAETKALNLKKVIKTNIESPELTDCATQLLISIKTLMQEEGSVFERSTFTSEHRETLIRGLLFLNRLQDQTFPGQDVEGREKRMKELEEDALQNLAPILEILNIHMTEQSQYNAFKPVAYVNKALIDMNSFKNWATELVFRRVKDHVDGLMQFIRREETQKHGILHHMALIPYLQAKRK